MGPQVSGGAGNTPVTELHREEEWRRRGSRGNLTRSGVDVNYMGGALARRRLCTHGEQCFWRNTFVSTFSVWAADLDYRVIQRFCRGSGGYSKISLFCPSAFILLPGETNPGRGHAPDAAARLTVCNSWHGCEREMYR